MCTPLFITALFIIARTWKQPRCPSADEWIRKPWYIYTMGYYSSIKKNTFVCRWTSRLLPCPSYYKQCCNEHWGTRVSFNSGFLGVCAQQWDCWVIWKFYFQFFKGMSTLFSIMAVLVCIPTNSVRGFPFLHILSGIYCL